MFLINSHPSRSRGILQRDVIWTRDQLVQISAMSALPPLTVTQDVLLQSFVEIEGDDKCVDNRNY